MPQVTLTDVSLRNYGLTRRVEDLRKAYFRAVPEVCVERAWLVTRFSLDHGYFQQDRISVLDKARLYRSVLENRVPVVRHTSAHESGMKPFEIAGRSLFAGSTTSKFKGVPLYPEFLALTLWPELWSLPKRASNPFYIAEDEVKKLNFDVFPHWIDNNISELARKHWKCDEGMGLLQRLVFFIASKPECISHTIPDFSRAITFGLRSIIEEAKTRQVTAPEKAQQEFYAALAEAMEGIIAYSRNLAIAARSLARGASDQTEREELLQLAEIHERVPECPARSFREALTTVWICWTAVHLENANAGQSLGRLDQVLYDLYRKDVDSGALTVEQAIELVCCLWLKIGDHVPAIPGAGEQLFGGTGSNQAITIGGVDKDGNDAVNDLTYVMLRATELMKLRDPNLNARYYSGVNSRDYLKRLCEANVNTGATPALHNDRAVIAALTAKGDCLEHARDYGVVGCVEPASNGRAYGHSGSILLNLTSALELTLYNGRHRHTGMDTLISKETGDPRTFRTFDDFKKAFAEQVQWLVEQSTGLNNVLGKAHQRFYPTPILSALFEGPMQKGMDLIEGGAVINSSGVAIIGLADVADSLSAIATRVFKGGLSMGMLLAALDADFEGYEPLRVLLMNAAKTPRYGNDDDAADGIAVWITELLDQAFGARENYRGGRYRVGYWTMTNHAGFGRLMGALPDGRKAGENFASGITPVSGVTPFLTATLRSVAKLPSKCLANGVALNIKYTPETADLDQMLQNFMAAVEGYFESAGADSTGGMEIQFNVANHDTFVDAVAHPEKYPELLVRVSGYTAYFRDLNPQMQKEIIDRTEYLLSTGKSVQFGPFPLPGRPNGQIARAHAGEGEG